MLSLSLSLTFPVCLFPSNQSILLSPIQFSLVGCVFCIEKENNCAKIKQRQCLYVNSVMFASRSACPTLTLRQHRELDVSWEKHLTSSRNSNEYNYYELTGRVTLTRGKAACMTSRHHIHQIVPTLEKCLHFVMDVDEIMPRVTDYSADRL